MADDSQNQDAAFREGAARADKEDRVRKFNVGMDKAMEGFQKPNTDVRDASGKHITVRGAPTMHDGGVVQKDGLHNLQKGEVVLSKDQVQHLGKDEGNKMKKHDFSHTVTEHHDDGSHTIHHIHKKHGHVHNVPKRDGDVKGSAGDHDQLMDHMMDHTSNMNHGEADADQGQHGVPAPQAAAAGLPSGAPPAAGA